MNKELSPLEALERAKREHCGLNQGFPDSEYIEELNNIETALKALEIIKKYIKVYKIHNGYMLTDENSGETMISKDEYDLLKEVML